MKIILLLNQKTVAAYAKLIKEAIIEKDIEKLADLTFFPVYVALSENPVVNTKRRVYCARYRKIIFRRDANIYCRR